MKKCIFVHYTHSFNRSAFLKYVKTTTTTKITAKTFSRTDSSNKNA